MDIEKALKSLKLKFTTENGIPVERASITRDEWEAVRDNISESDLKKHPGGEDMRTFEKVAKVCEFRLWEKFKDDKCATNGELCSQDNCPYIEKSQPVAVVESLKSPSLLSREEMVWLAVFGRMASNVDLGWDVSERVANKALEKFLLRFGKNGEKEKNG